MLLTLTLLGLFYVGGVVVMASGLAKAQPETERDAVLAEQIRRERAAAREDHGEMAGRPAALHA